MTPHDGGDQAPRLTRQALGQVQVRAIITARLPRLDLAGRVQASCGVGKKTGEHHQNNKQPISIHSVISTRGFPRDLIRLIGIANQFALVNNT